MKNKILIFLSFVIIASFTSCGSSSPLDMTNSISKMGLLDKGMTYDKFIKDYYEEPDEDNIVEYATTLSKSKAKIIICEEDLYTQTGPVQGQTSLTLFNFKSNTYLYDLFIFVDSKLYAWGRLDELKNNDESEVRDLANKVSKKILED